MQPIGDKDKFRPFDDVELELGVEREIVVRMPPLSQRTVKLDFIHFTRHSIAFR